MRAPGVLVLGLAFAMVIGGVAARDSTVMVLAIPLVAYLASAVVQRPERVDLDIRRDISRDQVAQGTPVEVSLTITNQGPVIEELIVDDVFPAGMTRLNGKSSAIDFGGRRAQIELEYTIEARRGVYKAHEVRVSAGDAHGLFLASSPHRTTPRLVVHPHHSPLGRMKIRPPQTRGFAGPIAARQGGAGIDFWGIREYQSGDQQRQINWRLAARSEHAMYINVFEQERVADVGLLLDARRSIDVQVASGSLFEHAVQATASLAESFLEEGNRVSLLVYGSVMRRVFPGYGRVQRDHIFDALAAAEPGTNYALDTLAGLPTRLFPAKSQIVIVSPLSVDDIAVVLRLRAQGYAVIVVSPDPVSFEAAAYRDTASPAYRLARAERELLLHQIRRSGVLVANWHVDQPLQGVIRTIFSRPPPAARINRIGLR